MPRRTTIAGLLVGGCCLMAAAPATAPASTNASKIKKLQHDVKVLSKRIRALNGFVSCLQFVDLTQYGDANATFGYMYTNDVTDPTQTMPTTGVDATVDGDSGTSFLIINPACGGGRAARVFGAKIVPPGKLIRAQRGD